MWNKPQQNKIVLLLDMNSYFASVEQQANPLLRGKPVGVCAYLSDNGCIIAASIEAKQRGVKTAMRVQHARRLCPDIVLVENEPAKYRIVSKAIFVLLAEYSDNVSPYSIDEAFVDLTGWVADMREAVSVAQTIKRRIKQEIGSWLQCSVGISFTHWLAKFAAEEHKPNGLTVIVVDQNDPLFDIDQDACAVYAHTHVFAGRPLQHACGIADRMAARLQAVGITDLGVLQQADPQKLMLSFGKYGYYLWAHVNGIEISNWIKKEGAVQKSVGHSYCVPKHVMDKVYLRQVLYKLCEKTGRRLREQNLVARSIYSGFSYVQPQDGQSIVKGEWQSRKLAVPIFTTKQVYEAAVQGLNQAVLKTKVRLLAVSVSSLSPFSPQLSFWGDGTTDYALGSALDKLNTKYGEYTVYPGIMHGMGDFAHDRIGFRKSVSVERSDI